MTPSSGRARALRPVNLALERLHFDPDIPGVVQLMLVTIVIGA
jgi:hypothetical protein